MKVNVSPQLETVWLSSNQMALLYGRDEKTIRKHVNKIFADGNKLIDDHTLVALTIMIAESKPDEKEMMISVIMNSICGYAGAMITDILIA